MALALLVVVCCGWILWLPVFPSQDGPIHVYYAAVSYSLLAGRSEYAEGFRLAHALPPYSLHSYLLMALMRVMPGAQAEKLLACLCVIAVALGFWYFARQLGPNGSLVAVFAAPFFLHRYLFFGFYGYCIGLGLALLAMGLWCRADRVRAGRRAAFVTVALLTSFTHPVPYALLLAYCGTEVVAGFVLSRSAANGAGDFVRPRVSDVVTLAVASLAALYVAGYAHSGALWTTYSRGELYGNILRIGDMVKMLTVSPLKARGYQEMMCAVFLLLGTLAVWQAVRDWSERRITRAQLALAWGVLVLLSLPLAPDAVNGSAIFAERLAIWSALLLMAPAASKELDGKAKSVALVVACVASVAALVMLNAHVGPVARQTDVSRRMASGRPGVHMYLADSYALPEELNYDPYLWAGVRVVEQEKGILVTSPFLDLAIMMLRPTEAQRSPGQLISGPGRLVADLRKNGGIVVTRCNQPPRIEPWLRETYAEWKVERYSCFEVLRP